MIAARLGCQVCVLCCALQTAPAKQGAQVTHAWPAAIAGNVMASVLQLVHLNIGFQVSLLLTCATNASFMRLMASLLSRNAAPMQQSLAMHIADVLGSQDRKDNASIGGRIVSVSDLPALSAILY